VKIICFEELVKYIFVVISFSNYAVLLATSLVGSDV
jgi:hypothetical protein